MIKNCPIKNWKLINIQNKCIAIQVFIFLFVLYSVANILPTTEETILVFVRDTPWSAIWHANATLTFSSSEVKPYMSAFSFSHVGTIKNA